MLLSLAIMTLYSATVQGRPCPGGGWLYDEAIVSDAVCALITEEDADNLTKFLHLGKTDIKENMHCTLPDFSLDSSVLSAQFSVYTGNEDSQEQVAGKFVWATKRALSEKCALNDACKTHYNCKDYSGFCRP